MTTTAGAPAGTGIITLEIDPAHSSVSFAVKHMMIATVRGEFGRVTGRVVLDVRDPSRSTVEATVDVAGITTREAQRDTHLRSADFFDVEKYPTMEFRSTRVTPKGGDRYEIAGEVTLHGVTRPIVLEAEAGEQELKDPYGNMKRAATATTMVNRKDFGLNWNVALEAGGILVGDEVKVTIDVALIRK